MLDPRTLAALLAAALLQQAQPAGGHAGVPPSEQVAGIAPSAEAARARYAKVEAELRAAAPKALDALDAEQRAARARLLDALASYRERGEFGIDLDPADRDFAYVDASGRRCAMAELMHASGRDDLVLRIAGEQNGAMIADLAADADVSAWLWENGLTLVEAARVQAPMTGGEAGGGGPDVPGTGGGNPGASGGGDPNGGLELPSYVPGDTVRTPPSGPASGGSAPTGPVSGPGTAPTPPPAGGPVIPGGAPAAPAPSAAPATTFGDDFNDDWWLWWEFNKLRWLTPNPLVERLVVAEESPTGTRTREATDALREELVPLVAAHLDHADARVRGSAVLAYSRVAGSGGVQRISDRLFDPSEDVRRAAILALGANASEESVHALLGIARTGKLAGEERDLTPLARPLAVVALGMARARGVGAGSEALVAALLRDFESDAHEYGEIAVHLYQTLAPQPLLAAAVRERAGGFRRARGFTPSPAGPLELPRAIETLRFDAAAEVVAPISHHLGARSLETRRSAALALGQVVDPLALPALQTAYDLEGEPVARGFLLLSIGEQGGDTARAFLVRELEQGPQIVQPWAALALGILGRDQNDAAAAGAIRAGLAKERNVDARGAYLLGLGLARDAESVELLSRELASSQARTRMFAASALAICGAENARDALAAAFEGENSASVRAAIALALGHLGDPRDAEALVDALAAVHHPELKGQYAAALGLHGTIQAARGLAALLQAERAAEPAARAAALEALGVLLAEKQGLLVPRLSAGANFWAFPGWLAEMLQRMA
jgi:HEAT repeat protein